MKTWALAGTNYQVGEVKNVPEKMLVTFEPSEERTHQVFVSELSKQLSHEVLENGSRIDALQNTRQIVENPVELVLVRRSDQLDRGPDVGPVVVKRIVIAQQCQSPKQLDSPLEGILVNLSPSQ